MGNLYYEPVLLNNVAGIPSLLCNDTELTKANVVFDYIDLV